MDEHVLAFATGARVARLATVGAGGSPHVVPVCFAISGGAVYIALDEKPKRLPPERLQRVRNLLANPRVQLLVDHYDEDWSRLGWVQISGAASLLRSGASEHSDALKLLRAKYSQYEKMELESRPVIRIAIERVTSWGKLG
jgi:PPOX class probable F420-dependent enzyme